MHLVLYDGRCALCNGAVRFLLRIDHRGMLMFASLQGETARSLKAMWERRDVSVILVSHLGTPEETVRDKSDAFLEIFRLLGGWWKPLAMLKVVPRSLRDCVYGWIARHRYRWFGQYPYEACPIPSPQHRERFLP
ncbi:MAG: hypothetical protein C4326_08385 [Ignavibacteria bacterium]